MVAKGIFLLSIYKCTHIKARTMIADKTPSNASRFSSVVSSPSSIPKMYDPNTLSSVFNCFNLFVNHLLNASLADDIFNTHAHVEWWTKKMKFNQSKRLTRWCVSNRSTQCINWITPNDFSRFCSIFRLVQFMKKFCRQTRKHIVPICQWYIRLTLGHRCMRDNWCSSVAAAPCGGQLLNHRNAIKPYNRSVELVWTTKVWYDEVVHVFQLHTYYRMFQWNKFETVLETMW